MRDRCSEISESTFDDLLSSIGDPMVRNSSLIVMIMNQIMGKFKIIQIQNGMEDEAGFCGEIKNG